VERAFVGLQVQPILKGSLVFSTPTEEGKAVYLSAKQGKKEVAPAAKMTREDSRKEAKSSGGEKCSPRNTRGV